MKNINKEIKLKLDTKLMKWLNWKKKWKWKWKKKVLKLKKQNEIKLEDIICNTYNVLLKFSPCNYQFFIFVKIKNDLSKKKKKKDDIKQSLTISFLQVQSSMVNSDAQTIWLVCV